jgi:nucleoside-diphosphate-sugar epimerase
MVGAMLALIAHPQAYGEVFNIGHTKEISIYDMAVLVKQMTGMPRRSCRCPTSRPTRPGSRTWRAGRRTLQRVRG